MYFKNRFLKDGVSVLESDQLTWLMSEGTVFRWVNVRVCVCVWVTTNRAYVWRNSIKVSLCEGVCVCVCVSDQLKWLMSEGTVFRWVNVRMCVWEWSTNMAYVWRNSIHVSLCLCVCVCESEWSTNMAIVWRNSIQVSLCLCVCVSEWSNNLANIWRNSIQVSEVEGLCVSVSNSLG